MRRTVSMIMLVMFLMISFSGCAILYTTSTETEEREVTEFGLLGFPDGKGLIPLYRQIEQEDESDDNKDNDTEK